MRHRRVTVLAIGWRREAPHYGTFGEPCFCGLRPASDLQGFDGMKTGKVALDTITDKVLAYRNPKSAVVRQTTKNVPVENRAPKKPTTKKSRGA